VEVEHASCNNFGVEKRGKSCSDSTKYRD
jgi:hypothetical protein